MNHSKVLAFFNWLAIVLSISLITFWAWYMATLIFYDITSQSTLSQIELVDFVGCSPKHRARIMQDRIDAQTIALAGLEAVDPTLAAEFPDLESYVEAGGAFTLDWSTEAAKEHWGSLSWESGAEADAHRTRILNTLWRATGTYPEMSSTLFPPDRRVQIQCVEFKEQTPLCTAGAIAYQYSRKGHLPTIALCPIYFKLLNLDEMHSLLENHESRSNVLNANFLRASALLHEGLHIGTGPAIQCHNPFQGHRHKGCYDYPILLKSGLHQTYGSGAAKLLASVEPVLASVTNDNYVFFAASRYIEKCYGQYPRFPSAWDSNKTEKENLDHQYQEPGFRRRDVLERLRST